MNKKTQFLILLILPIFMNFQCDKEIICPSSENNVAKIGVKVEPNLEQIPRNDTLWLISDFDNEIELFGSSEVLEVGDAECFLNFRLMRWQTDVKEISGGIEHFSFVNKKGEFVESVSDDDRKKYNGGIRFNCENGRCKYEIGLVPKLKGIYILYLWNGQFTNPNDTAECPAHNQFKHNWFDVDDFNTELYEEHNIPNVVSVPSGLNSKQAIQILDNVGVYFFEI